MDALPLKRQLNDWLQRKLSGSQCRLREAARASAEFRKNPGRLLYGHVTLSALPAAELSYTSLVTWPVADDRLMYEHHVFDGILDVLLTHGPDPVLGISVTLEEILWDDTGSCALAYGMAARDATRIILSPLNYTYVV